MSTSNRDSHPRSEALLPESLGHRMSKWAQLSFLRLARGYSVADRCRARPHEGGRRDHESSSGGEQNDDAHVRQSEAVSSIHRRLRSRCPIDDCSDHRSFEAEEHSAKAHHIPSQYADHRPAQEVAGSRRPLANCTSRRSIVLLWVVGQLQTPATVVRRGVLQILPLPAETDGTTTHRPR